MHSKAGWPIEHKNESWTEEKNNYVIARLPAPLSILTSANALDLGEKSFKDLE